MRRWRRECACMSAERASARRAGAPSSYACCRGPSTYACCLTCMLSSMLSHMQTDAPATVGTAAARYVSRNRASQRASERAGCAREHAEASQIARQIARPRRRVGAHSAPAARAPGRAGATPTGPTSMSAPESEKVERFDALQAARAKSRRLSRAEAPCSPSLLVHHTFCRVVIRARFFLTHKTTRRRAQRDESARPYFCARGMCVSGARAARAFWPLSQKKLLCPAPEFVVVVVHLYTSMGAGARSSVSQYPWRKSVSNLLCQSPCPHDLLRGHEAASYRVGTCLPWEEPLRNLA